MKEADLLKLVLDYLSATNILAFRLNTGCAKFGDRFVKFGVPGMSDVISFPRNYPFPVWIEVKSATGRMSEYQKSFQALVESHRHRYVLARSLDDVIRVVG